MINKKINFYKIINEILFIGMFGVRSITDAIFISKGVEKNFWVNFKYIILFLSIFWFIIQRNKKNKAIAKRELKCILGTIVLLTIISVFFDVVNWKFYKGLIECLFKMILPIVYVYYFINVMEYEEICICMVGGIIFSFLRICIRNRNKQFFDSKFEIVRF